MPERVKRIEGQVEVISSDLESIRSDLRRIADALDKLCDLEGPGQEFNGSADGGQSYVS
jgi:hypothetical protein